MKVATETLISVLLPVYNSAVWIDECLESLYAQTYQNWECLLVDDGSTDDLKERLKAHGDHRLRVYHLPKQRGVPGVLNFALERALGSYIARLDADDVMRPDRFQKQIKYFENNPDVDVLGSWAGVIGSPEIIKMPAQHDDIVGGLLFRGTLLHPTIMMRRRIHEPAMQWYDCVYRYAEDMELWLRLAAKVRFANCEEPLVYRRQHRAMSTFRNNKKMDFLVLQLRIRLAAEMTGENAEDGRLVCRLKALMRNRKATFADWTDWLEQLRAGSKNCAVRTAAQIQQIIILWQQDALRRLYLLKRSYDPLLFYRFVVDPAKPWRRLSFKVSLVLLIKCGLFWKARPFV